MADLTANIKHFTPLNRAPGPTWTEATKRKAPHKPNLLLAVLDLVHLGVITTPLIDVTGDLVELNDLFNLYWRRIVPLGQTSSIDFPFSRLDREPFWQLVPQPGKAITPAIINNTSSVTYLRRYALGAKLDEALFQIMQSGCRLTDHPGYCLRVGSWRVIYLVQEEKLLIAVVRIALRGEVYQ